MTAAITSNFNTIYDTYSPMVYGIALQIAPTYIDAEKILTTTFIKAHQQKIDQQTYPSIFIMLLKLIIETAHQQLNNNTGNTNFKIKQFKNTPIIHQIICEQMTLEQYCIQNNIAKEQASKYFRNELALILKPKSNLSKRIKI